MNDCIETYGDQAAAIFARESAWHKLGTTLPDGVTPEDALTIGHMGGWKVRLIPLQGTEVTDDGVTVVDAPDKFMIVRNSPWTQAVEYYGVAGKVFEPFQNEDTIELLRALTDESGAFLDTVGSLDGGRRTFVTMKLPQTMRIAGVDEISTNLAVLNGHDGRSKLRVVVTNVRVVCANTEAAALRNNHGIFAVKHTKNSRAIVSEARRALGLSFRYIEGFQEEAEKMIQETLTAGEFEKIVKANFLTEAPEDAEKGKRGQTMEAKKLETLMGLFVSAETQANIRGTRWAGYQAITEYMDHFAPVHALGRDVDVVRAERVLTGTGIEAKERAFDLFKV